MELFKWLNDQLLRMDWLSWLVRVLPKFHATLRTIQVGPGAAGATAKAMWTSSIRLPHIRTLAHQPSGSKASSLCW